MIRLRFFTLALVAGTLSLPGYAQMQPSAKQVQFAETITPADLRDHLSTLASDEYEGRETGQPGQRKAAAYIAGFFRSIGLPAIVEGGSYLQHMSFTSGKWEDINLSVANSMFRHMYDFYAFQNWNPSVTLSEKQVVFLGYGIDDPAYSDYEKGKAKGKVVMVYAGEPMKPDSTYWISGTQSPSVWSQDVVKKLEAARLHGVKALLIIDPNIQKSISDNRNKILGGGVKLSSESSTYPANIFISTTVARRLIGDAMAQFSARRDAISQTGKPGKLKLKSTIELSLVKKTGGLEGENVLGYIEGTDPALKDELVIVTAHYDHLGKRGNSIFNGADDNASGTSTVMEVAHAFAEAKQTGAGPRRSVLCMLVSGEEKGLLGSKYYVEHPVFSLAQTVANVNVDMVGRIDQKHEGNPDYIYVIGSDKLSTDLHRINEAANEAFIKLELDYTYNDPNDPNRYYYRSDHYNFAERGIPAIFYFNGTHDDYHRPTDDTEKIDFEKMAKIAKLVFYTTWELANRDERIRVDGKP
jgi:hypothetical protein